MRKSAELSHRELAAIVDAVQQALYLDFDAAVAQIWNPDKEWNGAETCEQLAAVLAQYDLAPEVPTPVQPEAP